MKRICDVIGALLGMIFLAPLFGSVAAAIAMTSGRPVFFCQVRTGRCGKPFVIRKFRTMRILCRLAGNAFEAGNRNRVTSFGSILRKTKVDELPQLWNVIRGEMSIVGPRPEVPEWVSAYPDRWEVVLSVRPGITDPASIIFRNEEALLASSPDPFSLYRDSVLPMKLGLYEDYVRTQSLARDLLIFSLTLAKIVFDDPLKG